MIDHVFSSFVELLRRNIETGEIVMKLDARPLRDSPEILRISLDGMDITRNAGVSIKEQTLVETRQQHISAQLNAIRTLLFAIAVMTGLIVLHIIFR
jgi:hypothetical protein